MMRQNAQYQSATQLDVMTRAHAVAVKSSNNATGHN
jgi:hypothetical protein